MGLTSLFSRTSCFGSCWTPGASISSAWTPNSGPCMGMGSRLCKIKMSQKQLGQQIFQFQKYELINCEQIISAVSWSHWVTLIQGPALDEAPICVQVVFCCSHFSLFFSKGQRKPSLRPLCCYYRLYFSWHLLSSFINSCCSWQTFPMLFSKPKAELSWPSYVLKPRIWTLQAWSPRGPMPWSFPPPKESAWLLVRKLLSLWG